jgi:hypothetical protein
MSDVSNQQRYSAGERISVGVELQDDTGIYDVTALFVHSDNPNAVLTLPGYGGGARRATVYIQNFVTTNTLPGQYVCKYIQAQDGRGNYSTLHPDISFYVDEQTVSVDGEGPELQGWDFPSEEIEVVEMSVIEAEKGDVQQYANRRPAEVASGMTEITDEQEDEQEDAQEDAQGAPPEDEWVDTQQYVENYISEQISGMTEDTEAGADIDLHIERSIAGMTEETGSGGDIGAHIESRMDEIAHDVTEETGSEGDPHLHVQRRMEEMAKDIFEDD